MRRCLYSANLDWGLRIAIQSFILYSYHYFIHLLFIHAIRDRHARPRLQQTTHYIHGEYWCLEGLASYGDQDDEAITPCHVPLYIARLRRSERDPPKASPAPRPDRCNRSARWEGEALPNSYLSHTG